MEVLTLEVYRFDELDSDAQARAIKEVEGGLYFIEANRYRFFKNGLAFDALGIEK